MVYIYELKDFDRAGLCDIEGFDEYHIGSLHITTAGRAKEVKDAYAEDCYLECEGTSNILYIGEECGDKGIAHIGIDLESPIKCVSYDPNWDFLIVTTADKIYELTFYYPEDVIPCWFVDNAKSM